jgi:hypothetical protein
MNQKVINKFKNTLQIFSTNFRKLPKKKSNFTKTSFKINNQDFRSQIYKIIIVFYHLQDRF